MDCIIPGDEDGVLWSHKDPAAVGIEDADEVVRREMPAYTGYPYPVDAVIHEVIGEDFITSSQGDDLTILPFDYFGP